MLFSCQARTGNAWTASLALCSAPPQPPAKAVPGFAGLKPHFPHQPHPVQQGFAWAGAWTLLPPSWG